MARSTIRKKRRNNSKRRNSNGTLWIWITLFTLIGFILVRNHYNTVSSHRPYSTYEAFGIPMPDGYDIHGIDISYFQEKIPWHTLKKVQDNHVKIGFVFIKATEGLNHKDKMFDQNWPSARLAGIPRGAYHYFIASKSGKEQAENYIRNVHLQPGDLPPVIDIEKVKNTSRAEMRKEVKEWLETVEKAYGVKPIIYSFATFYRDYLGSDFDAYPLWVAHYQNNMVPRIDRSWLFWQHDEGGKIKGIKGKFDFNVFNGDSSDFRNLLIPEK